jgi:hypothetical protein
MNNDPNIEKINSYCLRNIRNRIIYEYKKLKEKYNDIFVETDGYTNNMDDTRVIKIVIYCNSNNIFTIDISNHYPFYSPVVYLGNKPYYSYLYLSLPSSRFQKIYKELSGIDCMCCSSVLCKGNWTPTVSLLAVIEEYEMCKKTKSSIIRKILMDAIKDKYLTADIDIESWIFGFKLNIQNTHLLSSI